MTIHAISVRGLSKRFGETEVLHGIDLDIEAGEVTCLIGPSGSGKSTLLRCMAFLEEATTGSILINDQPLGFEQLADGTRVRLGADRIQAARAQIGMCFQQFNLWPHMTALGNVRLGRVTTLRNCRVASSSGWLLRARWRWSPK